MVFRIVFLAATMVFSINGANAGLLGDLVGAAIVHHENAIHPHGGFTKPVGAGITGRAVTNGALDEAKAHPFIATAIIGVASIGGYDAFLTSSPP